jgi:hypothetical protein
MAAAPQRSVDVLHADALTDVREPARRHARVAKHRLVSPGGTDDPVGLAKTPDIHLVHPNRTASTPAVELGDVADVGRVDGACEHARWDSRVCVHDVRRPVTRQVTERVGRRPENPWLTGERVELDQTDAGTT